MSTAAIEKAPTPSALAITTDVLTLYRVVFKTGEVDKEGNAVQDFDVVNEKVGTEAEEKKLFKGYEVVQVNSYSATKYSANSDAGAIELIPSEEERVAMFNRGTSTKQDNKFRQILKSTEEDGSFSYTSEEVYDMREDLKTPTNRRLSPFEKLMESVSTIALTPEMYAAFDALMAQRKAEMQQGQGK